MALDPLSHLIQKKQIPHALLIVDGIKRAELFARELTQAEANYHPDIHALHPEGKSGLHTIESLRQLTSDVALSSFQSPYKVFLIYEAERMLPTSSNALLKTFEEPTAGTVIILLTRRREKMLPTILSRCQTYFYHETVEQFPVREAVVAAMQGDLSRLSEIEAVLEEGNENVDALLELVMRLARDAFLIQSKLPPHLLFFSDAKALPIPSLSHFEKRVREARLGFERSIKKHSVLRYLFSQAAI